MAQIPETRNSLLLRVKDHRDHAAWEEFLAIYRPVVHRFGRQHGLQDADAQDLVQNVLSAVAHQIEQWHPDRSRGRFRTWLLKIAFNQTMTIFRRQRKDVAQGGTTGSIAIQSMPEEASALHLNYRREVFRQIAAEIRQEFEEATWQAFWMTAVDNCSVANVAERLQLTVGAVYTARSRIFRRLRDRVRENDDDEFSAGEWT